MSGKHSTQTSTEGIHMPFGFIFADSTERGAYSPLVTDLGKMAWQEDDDSFYILTAVSPSTVWTEIGGGAGGTSLQRSFQDASFTAVADTYYLVQMQFVDFTITLPASPNIGDSLVIEQALHPGPFSSSILVIDPNGESINGVVDDVEITSPGTTIALTYNGDWWNAAITHVGLIGHGSDTTTLYVIPAGKYTILSNNLSADITFILPTTLFPGIYFEVYLSDMASFDLILDGDGNDVDGGATKTYTSTDEGKWVKVLWSELSGEWKVIETI